MSRPESRKGEVNELRGMLKNPKVPAKTSVEKVIAYMTLGIDVSPLFTEMLMMTHTKDLIQKKMVYLYLCSYADLNPELAVLAINTLQRDCQEDDPLIRGLALRSLCGLRVKNLVEYIVTPIRKCLADNSAYVRKVAVVGVAKLFSVDPAAVKSSDFVDQLFNKLNDRDNEVVINAVFALNEILADEGGMPMNKKIIYHLVNKLHEFHEWGQCAVLELLARYETASQEEMFDMMNLLEDRLKHANSAVVLAATKVFLNFTRNMEKLHIEVYQRLKAPLLTLIGGNNVEICFAVLTHVSLLVKRCNGIFNDQFRNFFIRYNDPLWVKSLKIEILGEISDSDNATEIIAELSEYITNVDVEIASTAIHALGKISVNVESHSSSAIEHLLSFLDLGIDYVNTATCIAMKDILRRYPDRYEEILPGLHKVLKSVEDPEGKVAAIWILGEYGDLIGDAPYIVEPLIENFNHESSSSVKLEILTTTMKLFFKRPPEVHKMLGALLSTVISDCTDVDVRDRALLLYRLLKYDVHEAARIVNVQKIMVANFVDRMDSELNDRLFEEFNSLSVVYGKPSEQFVNIPIDLEEEEAEEDEEAGAVTSGKEQEEINLLSHDYMGDAYRQEEPVEASPKGLVLTPYPQCDPSTFQTCWMKFLSAAALQKRLKTSVDVSVLESVLASAKFSILATGATDSAIKVYAFAQTEELDHLFLVEVVVETGTALLSATFKGDDEGITKLVAEEVFQELSSL